MADALVGQEPDVQHYRHFLGCISATANDTFQTMGPAPNITIHVPGPLRTYCAGAAQLSISAHTVRAALGRAVGDINSALLSIAMSVTKPVRCAGT